MAATRAFGRVATDLRRAGRKPAARTYDGKACPDILVVALGALLEDSPESTLDSVRWLA